MGQATFLPPFLLCYSSVWMMRLHFPFVLGLIRISGLDGKLAAGCLRIGSAWIVFCFRCWVADDKNGGMASLALGAGWRRLWAAPALSPSCGALSKSATLSHLSGLFSIIETKLSGVRGSLPMFSRAVITSSQCSRNAGHSNRVCQASSSHPLLLQLEYLGLSASFMRNR